jgi:hypothetical protein
MNGLWRAYTQLCDAEQRVADGAARHPYQLKQKTARTLFPEWQ